MLPATQSQVERPDGRVELTDTSRIEQSALYKDRKSTRLNSSHANISYAVFCLKKKKRHITLPRPHVRSSSYSNFCRSATLCPPPCRTVNHHPSIAPCLPLPHTTDTHYPSRVCC